MTLGMTSRMTCHPQIWGWPNVIPNVGDDLMSSLMSSPRSGMNLCHPRCHPWGQRWPYVVPDVKHDLMSSSMLSLRLEMTLCHPQCWEWPYVIPSIVHNIVPNDIHNIMPNIIPKVGVTLRHPHEVSWNFTVLMLSPCCPSVISSKNISI